MLRREELRVALLLDRAHGRRLRVVKELRPSLMLLVSSLLIAAKADLSARALPRQSRTAASSPSHVDKVLIDAMAHLDQDLRVGSVRKS